MRVGMSQIQSVIVWPMTAAPAAAIPATTRLSPVSQARALSLAMAAEQVLRMIWGTTGLPFSIPDALRGQLHVSDFIYSYYRLTMLAVAAFRLALSKVSTNGKQS